MTVTRRPDVAVGFALTQHCNLRCPHCIRDDVTSMRELDLAFVMRIVREARDLFGDVEASFTGGEPTLHRNWAELVDGLKQMQVPYTFVSNGWFMRRLMPLIDHYPPAGVRLSLSGADAATHDEERGRDSFRRVLIATALLTSRQVPTRYSFIVDRRTRDQIPMAVELARDMGVHALQVILPQPVPASGDRDTDLAPHEWWEVVREVRALAAGSTSLPHIIMDYGAPFLGESHECSTMTYRRAYVDSQGRMSTCCQLSDYGANEVDVVADLNVVPFADAWAEHVRRIEALKVASQPTGPDDALAPFPCLRCARASGKMNWLRHYPSSPWAFSAGEDVGAPLVPISYSKRARRVVSVLTPGHE